MKERPILFSAPMVRAILDGAKTQTRQIIPDGWWRCLDWDDDDDRARAATIGPYGVPGDRLWVRETWYCDDYTANDFVAARKGYVGTGPTDDEIVNQWRVAMDYRADHDCNTYEAGCPCSGDDGRSCWRPSIHMPRWASRITLEVTEVRVQRLQEISEDDAEAEGCDSPLVNSCDEFALLWESINGKRAPWSNNPWVWAISFKVLP